MKLTSETPPGGDFVRYLEAIERESPAYQALRASDEPTAAPAAPPRAVLPSTARAQRAQRTAGRGPAPAPVPPPFNTLMQSAWLRKPLVRVWAAPLLNRLQRALAEAARKS